MEVDQCLIGKFSSMGTTDKDVLVSQFCNLLGLHVDKKTCEFFLEMNNWNLQAAIGAYYDYKTPQTKVPVMSFIRDVTIGEGESVPPNTEFMKTWCIQNEGDESWPINCTLRFVNGDKLQAPDWVSVSSLGSKEVSNVSVKMQSPAEPGIYQGQWKMFNQAMMPFGDVIWVIITVEAGGLLGVTQQMSKFASALGNNSEMSFDDQSKRANNPFSFGSTDADMETGGQLQDGSNTGSSACMSPAARSFQSNLMCQQQQSSSPGLRKIPANPHPSPCWSERSPTSSAPVDELLGGHAHSLTVINEESNNSAQYNYPLVSQSPYDLNASLRQVSPTGSPTRMKEIENTLQSPDAPSPIRPSGPSRFSKSERPLHAAQRLDFSSGS